MNKTIETRVEAVARSAFGLSPSQSLSGFTYKDHPRWDSLGHIQLILALEKEFGVKFSSGEVISARTLGEIVSIIAHKKGKSGGKAISDA